MGESLKGKLLIASPSILDPNFRRTVVLMTEHGDEGAMGLILNRAAETTVGEAVPDLAWLAGDDIVHVGGPVSPQSVVVLAEFEEPAQSALLVEDDLGFVPAEVAGHRRAGRRAGPPARLRRATPAGAPVSSRPRWRRSPGSSSLPVREDVFTDDPEDLWSRVLRRKGREYALLSTMPVDPSLN